jgi:hypothetical protein
VYEFWFHGVTDPQDNETFNFHGTTSDFLEVICQISEKFDEEIAGNFTQNLMEAKKDERQFLRIEKWEFDWVGPLADEVEKRIVLHKVR